MSVCLFRRVSPIEKRDLCLAEGRRLGSVHTPSRTDAFLAGGLCILGVSVPPAPRTMPGGVWVGTIFSDWPLLPIGAVWPEQGESVGSGEIVGSLSASRSWLFLLWCPRLKH